MTKELRDVFNPTFVKDLILAIKNEYDGFDGDACHDLIFQKDWKSLALKERMRHITISIHEFLPKDYLQALEILYKVAPQFTGLKGIIFPDYVEQYGLGNWDVSINALAIFTPYSTSEFAVRPFLQKNLELMIEQMLEWSLHSDEHIRRLASEGSRPRLPRGMSVLALKANPMVTLPILENLKEDESLYVRKSVANHLNDISYTHPEVVLDIAYKWFGKHKHTDWIIKHACRSLLKKGNSQALALFGYQEDDTTEVSHINLESSTISIGENLSFSFSVTSKKELPIRLEYSIDYVKSRGQRTKKVFMIQSVVMKPNETRSFSKKQSFKDMTTRKHYSGMHTLSIIVNGQVKASVDFKVAATT